MILFTLYPVEISLCFQKTNIYYDFKNFISHPYAFFAYTIGYNIEIMFAEAKLLSLLLKTEIWVKAGNVIK